MDIGSQVLASHIGLPCTELLEIPVDSSSVPTVPASAKQRHTTCLVCFWFIPHLMNNYVHVLSARFYLSIQKSATAC